VSVQRFSIGPPQVNPEDAAVYALVGGISSRGHFTVFERNYGTLSQYHCTAKGDLSIVYRQIADANSYTCTIKLQKASGFNILVTRDSDAETKPQQILQASMKAVAPFVFDGLKGCQPMCMGGTGSEYLSCPYLSMTSFQNGPVNGVGWCNFQRVAVSLPQNNVLDQIIYSFVPPMRWLWIVAQVSSTLQFWTYVMVGTDGPISGQPISVSFKKYSGTTIDYDVPGSITILATLSRNGVKYPTRVLLELDAGRRYILSAETTQSGATSTVSPGNVDFMMNPDFTLAAESYGILYDAQSTSQTVVGVGFIEANGLRERKQVMSEALRVAFPNTHLSEDELNALADEKLPMTRVALLGAGVLFILLLLVVGLVHMHRMRGAPTASS
jgi:hypothetical protein